jgi:hypothetical protein
MRKLAKAGRDDRGRRGAPRGQTARVGLENLEGRELMATLVDFSDGMTLKITGDAASNFVEVQRTNADLGTVLVREKIGTSYRSLGFYQRPLAVVFNGGDGDDVLDNLSPLPTIFRGGAGRDSYYGSPGPDVFADFAAGETFLPRQGLSVVADQTARQLRISGSADQDYVFVVPEGTDRFAVDMEGAYFGGLAGVDRIDFNGNAGHDVFGNLTSLPTTINGGPGNDTLYGGCGNDVFMGSEGYDQYDTRAFPGGSDALFRNGHRGALNGPGVTVGLVSGQLSPEELSARGDLTITRSGNHLTFSGPSGAGFRLRSTWTSFDYNGSTYYYTSTPVVVESAMGDVPLAPGFVFFTARSSGVPDVGTFTGSSLSGLSIDTTTPGSPFASLGQQSGLGIRLSPGGAQLGIGLGTTVKDAGINAPVNAAVPYLYFSITTSTGLTFGGVEVKPPGSAIGVQGVFDPSDPFLFARVEADAGKSPIEEFALGWSSRGQIPFAPKRHLADVSEKVFGHLYSMASVKLGNYPIKIQGETVIDLDANDDGQKLGLSGSQLAAVTRGDLDLGTIAGALADLRIGLNGAGSLSFDKTTSNGALPFKLSAPLSEATVLVTPSNIAIGAGSANMLAGTPLENHVQGSSFEVQARYGPIDRSWALSAWSNTAKIAHYTFGSVALATSSSSQAISVNARFAPPMGFGAVYMSGQLGFNGDFSLSGSAVPVNINAGIATLQASAYFSLSHTAGNVSFNAWLYASYSQNLGILGQFSGGLYASISMGLGTSGFRLSGYGSMWATLDVAGPADTSINLAFTVSTSGFHVGLSGLPSLSVSW